MFSKDITNSEEFLEMPDSTQKLYFHLGMNADDDGFVQPKGVMRMVRSGEDDLKVLQAKGFVIIFNESVIVITQWKMNNEIRVDRYKPTIYQEHLKSLKITENKAYIMDKNMVVPTVVPLVPNLDTQIRLGKDRLGKVTSVAKSDAPFNFQEELEKLKNDKRKDFKIIALFWRKKGWDFQNRLQFNAALKRELRAAKDLKGYTGDQIARSMAYCAKEYPEIWTLETVGKRITDVVNKKS